MKTASAREELEQYIETQTFECPGAQWTVRYAGHWEPGWRGLKRTVRRSRQLCILDCETFPTPQAYAAQVNWNTRISKFLSHEPTWRQVPKPPRPGPHEGWTRDEKISNTWARDVYQLLRARPPKWAGFTFAPKGKVT